MLSNNRFFGNAGRSRWLAGLLPGYAGALQDWTRTEVAAAMPKTAAVPAGYGSRSMAMPREAGAFASYNGIAFAVASTADVAASYVQSASVEFAVDASVDGATGVGLATVDGSFAVDATAAFQAEAPMEVLATFAVVGVATLEAAAAFEALCEFAVDVTAELGAGAAFEALSTFAVASSAVMAGSISIDATSTFSVGATLSNPVGVGVWEATTEEQGQELTPANISAAVWNAAAASYNAPGTMGNKMNTASSGGVDLNDLADAVWNAAMASGLSFGDSMKAMAAILYGKTSVTPTGPGTATVVFRDPLDTKDVVTALMNGSVRTNLTLNP